MVKENIQKKKQTKKLFQKGELKIILKKVLGLVILQNTK